MIMDLVEYIGRQREWSRRAFGPGERLHGVLDHMAKEMDEVRAAPGDVYEWVDLIILALDGAWRQGHDPDVIAGALLNKQARNAARVWPDWRTRSEDEAIEHVRAYDRGEPYMGPLNREAIRRQAILECQNCPRGPYPGSLDAQSGLPTLRCADHRGWCM